MFPFQYLPPPDLTVVTRGNAVCLRGACFRFNICHHQILPWLPGATLFVSDGHVSVSISAITRSYRGYQGQHCVSQKGMFPFQYQLPADLTMVTRGNTVCLRGACFRFNISLNQICMTFSRRHPTQVVSPFLTATASFLVALIKQ